MNLTFLGIYEDAIGSAREDAENFIEEASDLLDTLGEHEVNAPFYSFDIDADALSCLKESIRADDLTNSIIEAYFRAAIGCALQNSYFEKHGFSFTTAVNGDDSYIDICREKEDGKEYQHYYAGTLTNMVRDALFDEVWAGLSPLLDEFMSDSGEAFDRAWLENDLASLGDGEFFETIEELREYVDAGELSEEFKEELKESLGMEERD